MQSKIVILGTGGTIAGTAASVTDAVGYTAAQIGVAQLVAAVPPLAGLPIECEQVAQIDSKDMDHATWQRLAQRCAHHLARHEVAGVVVTHGTDTLEETAYFLHRVLAPAKPLVMTAAMRPATSLQADGPQNLLDAVTLVRDGRVAGVSAVIAGRAWAGVDLRKVHTYRLDAFDGGDAGPLASIEDGKVRVLCLPAANLPSNDRSGLGRDQRPRPRPGRASRSCSIMPGPAARSVDALMAQKVDGLVAAGTGNGGLGAALEAALRRRGAQRCARSSVPAAARPGTVQGGDSAALPTAGQLTAVQARVECFCDFWLAFPSNAPDRRTSPVVTSGLPVGLKP
jgi:L-asparaginase